MGGIREGSLGEVKGEKNATRAVMWEEQQQVRKVARDVWPGSREGRMASLERTRR